MRLRIGVGVFMLGLLIYNLIVDRQFDSEFFSLSGTTLTYGILIGAFLLPDKFAWPFQAIIAGWMFYGSIFLSGEGVDPASDRIITPILGVVFTLLAILTFRNWRKPPTPKVTQESHNGGD